MLRKGTMPVISSSIVIVSIETLFTSLKDASIDRAVLDSISPEVGLEFQHNTSK